VVGLYTSLVMLVLYAALGTSRLLSVTTSSTIAILASGALATVAPGGDPTRLMSASATLSLLVGAFLLMGGILRLGVVANLISDPVSSDGGIGLVIVLDQAQTLGRAYRQGRFFQDIFSILRHLRNVPSRPHAHNGDAGLMLGLNRSRRIRPLLTVAVGIACRACRARPIWDSLVGTVKPDCRAPPDLT
jgi:hypothetical protein